MNLALSDEQEFLREAARGALSRHKTLEAAREALEDPEALPDLWPVAVEAGWPGLLIDEDHGGAGLGVFDAMLVAEECGRVLAGVYADYLWYDALGATALWRARLGAARVAAQDRHAGRERDRGSVVQAARDAGGQRRRAECLRQFRGRRRRHGAAQRVTAMAGPAPAP